MNKDTFLAELRRRLSGLPQNDIDEHISYYSEMIDDRIEDGMSEEEAVAGIGSVESIVEQIMAEVPLSRLVKEKVKPQRDFKVWEIILLILGAPLWIPLVIAAILIILSLYIVVWSLVISVYTFVLSFAATAIAGLISVFIYLGASNPVGAIFSIGIGIACAGLAILSFYASVWITKKVIKLTGKLLLGIKTSFVGKEE